MKLKKSGLLLLGFITIIMLATSGCAQKGEEAPPAPTPQPVGDIDAGKQLFIATENACFTCHAVSGVPEATGTLGPDLSDIGAREDKAYIRESIVNPNATIAEGYTDLMTPFGFDQKFTEEELNNLVSFLASLKG